jgi:hypothetical protein
LLIIRAVNFRPTAQLDLQQSELIEASRNQPPINRSAQWPTTIDASKYKTDASIALAETIFIRFEMACVNAI